MALDPYGGPNGSYVLDTLQGGPGLSASWATGTVLGDSGLNLTEDSSGAFVSAANQGGSAVWRPAIFGVDAECFMTIATSPGTSTPPNVSVWVRVQYPVTNTDCSAYFLRWVAGSTTLDLRKKLNGGASTSMTTFTQSVGSGDSIAISAVGSTISCWWRQSGKKWSLQGSTTDTSIGTAGSAGFTTGSDAANASGRMTNWGAGTIYTVPQSSNPVGRRFM